MKTDTIKYIISDNKPQLGLIVLSIPVVLAVVWFVFSQGGGVGAILSGALSLLYITFLILSIYNILGTPNENENIDSWIEKKAIEADISNTISNYSICFSVKDTLVPDWQYEANRSDILNSDDEIMVLKRTASEEWNLGAAAIQYSKKCVIPGARPFIRDDVSMGIDNFVSEDILVKSGKTEAKSFLHKHLSHEFKKLNNEEKERIRLCYYQVKNIRKYGFFGPILLKEYNEITKQGRGPPSNVIMDESAEFLATLEDIAIRNQPGELENPGRYFDVKIGIVGGYMSTEGYLSRAKESIQQRNVAYSVAEGENIDIVDEMAPELSEDNMGKAIMKSEVDEFKLPDDAKYDRLKRIRLEKYPDY